MSGSGSSSVRRNSMAGSLGILNVTESLHLYDSHPKCFMGDLPAPATMVRAKFRDPVPLSGDTCAALSGTQFRRAGPSRGFNSQAAFHFDNGQVREGAEPKQETQ